MMDRLKAALFAHCEKCGCRLNSRMVTFDASTPGGARRWRMICPNVPACGTVSRYRWHGQYRLARFRSWLYWTFPELSILPQSWYEKLFFGVCYDCRNEVRWGKCGCPEERKIDPDLEAVL